MIFCKDQCHQFSHCSLKVKKEWGDDEFFIPLCYELFLSHSGIEWLQQLFSICHQINWNPVIVISSLQCFFLAVMWNVFIYYSKTKERDLPQHGGESLSLPPLFLRGVSSVRGNLFCEIQRGVSFIDTQNAFSRIWWTKILNECGRENDIDHLISSFVAGEVSCSVDTTATR